MHSFKHNINVCYYNYEKLDKFNLIFFEMSIRFDSDYLQPKALLSLKTVLKLDSLIVIC